MPIILESMRSVGMYSFEYPAVPPKACATMLISSSLNLVGLMMTLAPFESVHSVVPHTLSSLVDTILPGLGATVMSGSILKLSTKGVISSASTAARAEVSSSFVGIFVSSFSGASTMIARLSGLIMEAKVSLIDASGVIFASCCINGHSISRPGIGEPSIKLRTYSLTKVPFSRVARLLYKLSYDDMRLLRARSYSLWVNPPLAARSISRYTACRGTTISLPLATAVPERASLVFVTM